MNKTLNEVQAGDKVVLCTRGEREVVEVTRTTKTQIICGYLKFSRKNGYRISSNKWDLGSIQPLTPEIQQQIDKKKKKDELYNNVRIEIKRLERTLGKLSEASLQQLLSTLREYNDK